MHKTNNMAQKYIILKYCNGCGISMENFLNENEPRDVYNDSFYELISTHYNSNSDETIFVFRYIPI